MERHIGSCVMGEEEIKQIEEWTQMKIGNVIFDSDVDNWNVKTSAFDQKIINKSNLLFLVETKGGDLFGEYSKTEINRYDDWIIDPKSFVFSLKSNGRLNRMIKIESVAPQQSFYLYNQSDRDLFCLAYQGWFISVRKEKNRIMSYTHMTKYNLDETKESLTKENGFFCPLRVMVIQLI